MRRLVFGALALIALAAAVGPAEAKSKAKPKVAAAPATGVQLTQLDVRNCMGLANDSTPQIQVAACTKVINSGKVNHPYEGDYYATRGAAYFAENDLDNAMADLNKAISIRQSPEFYMQRGMVHTAKYEWDEARADLDKTIALTPTQPVPHLIRGVIAYKTGDYKEALKFFEACVQRAPTFYKGIFARGVAKKKLGDVTGGDKDIADARAMSAKVDQDFAKLGMTP